MTESIHDYIADVRSDTFKFERLWTQRHQEDPLRYPMAIDKNNSGLWGELFAHFQATGNI